ncbi:MAG: hypothetical protein GY749_18680 [Desulfobacteraceae bacterium]|nr:hypothetical protein [Desulfobacteraceae bacterium]
MKNTKNKCTRWKSLLKFALVLVFLGSLSQCIFQQSGVVINGKQFGVVKGNFRHRWWNYYERGISYADGGYYDKKLYHNALDDFSKAIELRKKDQRMARTYGVKFIDYFPNREKGIVFYHLGRLDEAVRALELSFHHFPTTKAELFLALVRKRISMRKRNRTAKSLYSAANSSLVIPANTELYSRNAAAGDESSSELTIALIGSLADKQRKYKTYLKKIYVQGIVSSNSEIAEIIINNKKIYHPERKEVTIHHIIRLDNARLSCYPLFCPCLIISWIFPLS